MNAGFSIFAALLLIANFWTASADAAAPKKARQAQAAPVLDVEDQKALVRDDPHNVRMLCGLGIAYAKAGLNEQAIEVFKIANRINPDEAVAFHLYYGNACNAAGLYQEAFNLFKEALQLDPKNPDLLCGLGKACAQLKLPKEAVAAYEQATRIKKDHARAQLELGVLFGDLGRYAEAEPCLVKAAGLLPQNYMAHCALGFIYSGLGRQQQALPEYRKAITIDPEDALAYYGLAAALIRGGLYKSSAEAYSKGAAADRVYAHATSSHGLVYGGFARPQAIIETIKTALQVDPSDAYAHFNLGVLQLVSGDDPAAFLQYGELSGLDQALAGNLFQILFP